MKTEMPFNSILHHCQSYVDVFLFKLKVYYDFNEVFTQIAHYTISHIPFPQGL